MDSCQGQGIRALPNNVKQDADELISSLSEIGIFVDPHGNPITSIQRQQL
jgi:hypothetical protein